MPKWLKYDSEDDFAESAISKRTNNRKPHKSSRYPDDESPRRQLRKRSLSSVAEYAQNWIPVEPSRHRKNAQAR